MKDQDIEKLISQSVDGELDAAGRAMLIRKEGPMFSDVRDGFKSAGDLMREGASEGMPTAEALLQDVQREIRAGSTGGEDQKPVRWLPWALAAAAVIAIGVASPFLREQAVPPPVQTAAVVEYLSTDLPGADIGSYVLPESEVTVIWVFEKESDEG
ncbi:MAG: hypothetical protein ACI9TH_004868 [Kiritimatiellia bacterium]|jgi:hypothetical protein